MRFVSAHPLVVAALMLLGDLSMYYRNNYLVRATLQDEFSHLLTAALILALVGRRASLPFTRAALIASISLDVDHIPLYLGWIHLPPGIDRPYTHSLATVLCVTAASLLLGKRRPIGLAVACGLALHLARDLFTGSVPLLWPVLIGVYLPYPLFAGGILALSGGLAWRNARERRTSANGPLRGLAGPRVTSAENMVPPYAGPADHGCVQPR